MARQANKIPTPKITAPKIPAATVQASDILNTAVKPAADEVVSAAPTRAKPASQAPAPQAKVLTADAAGLAEPSISKPAPGKAVAPKAARGKPPTAVPHRKPVTAAAPTAAPPLPAAVKPFAATLPTPAVLPTPQALVPPPYQVIPMATTAFKGFEDFSAFGKDNFEAMVQANTLFAKGIEDFGKEFLSLTQANLETAATATKAIFSAKSLKEVVELNSELTKSGIEKLVSTSSKLSELGMKVTTDALAPINARVNVAVDKLLKPMAA
ncbi:MAG TPA: TIGR01841 family phasin [Bradyrhizobium sp.]|nr:TIGR01841 family phasin [Bradyrhizobium sp.]